MFRRPRGGMRRGGQGLGLFLLLAQIMHVGFNNIPPTTLATIALNVAIYLKVLNSFFKRFLRPAAINQICVSSYHVWYKGDWMRLLLAGWFHLDEWHLYYNMVSFMWKGRGLEGTFGTPYFAYLILIFSVVTNAVMVGINIAVAELLNDGSYVSMCAAGFSGVIFALKVLTSYYRPTDMQVIFGIPVPSAWACWIELVIIQLLVPNASFTGHLAGILVGLAYVKGPLKTLMNIIYYRDIYAQSAPSYTYTAGTAHGRSSNRQGVHRSTRSNSARSSGQRSYTADSTGSLSSDRNDGMGDGDASARYQANDFTGGMTEEEQLEAAIRESVRSGGPPVVTPSAPPVVTPSAPPVHLDSSSSPTASSPTLPPHRDSSQPSTSGSVTPPLLRPNPVHNTRATTYNDIDQDELRRRRLARFDR